MNEAQNLNESTARFILQYDFVVTDFVYNESESPINNILRAIEMYGDRRYDSGDTNGYDRGYTIGYDTGYSSGYDSAVINYMN